ncbi:MAG: phage tail assembly protein [Campylobacteraceae bacterium]|nr:phage tail assembly protein [Campylobacteraceae bacterium]
MSIKINLPGAKKDVEMREPKVKDMRAVSTEENQEEKEIKLISNLTGMSIVEIDDLSLKDYALLAKGLSGFL